MRIVAYVARYQVSRSTGQWQSQINSYALFGRAGKSSGTVSKLSHFSVWLLAILNLREDFSAVKDYFHYASPPLTFPTRKSHKNQYNLQCITPLELVTNSGDLALEENCPNTVSSKGFSLFTFIPLCACDETHLIRFQYFTSHRNLYSFQDDPVDLSSDAQEC